MPMLMLQCKTCEVFPGIYIAEGSTDDFKTSATNADSSHIHVQEVIITNMLQ
jgi:hypothetical protein